MGPRCVEEEFSEGSCQTSACYGGCSVGLGKRGLKNTRTNIYE